MACFSAEQQMTLTSEDMRVVPLQMTLSSEDMRIVLSQL